MATFRNPDFEEHRRLRRGPLMMIVPLLGAVFVVLPVVFAQESGRLVLAVLGGAVAVVASVPVVVGQPCLVIGGGSLHWTDLRRRTVVIHCTDIDDAVIANQWYSVLGIGTLYGRATTSARVVLHLPSGLLRVGTFRPEHLCRALAANGARVGQFDPSALSSNPPGVWDFRSSHDVCLAR